MNRVPNLDEYLEMVGFWRKLVPRDGRCLFRSLGEQLFGTQTIADELLNKCAGHLEKNSSKFLRHLSHPVDQYLTSVRKAQTCAGHPHLDVFLEIVSSLYDCAIVVYHQSSAQPTCIWTKSKHPRTIELCKIGKHYDTVMSRDRVAAYAQCQSLLFDLLYSRVFQMPEDEIDFGVSALRHKVNKRKDSVSEGMCLESADDSGHGGDSSEMSPNKMPFSYRAAKGLDINIFRNIAFDIWREENLDRTVGDQFLIPGNQCIVQLSDISEDDGLVDSEAIIQDYDDESQIVSAFVQSLGMRVEVPREAVKSVSDRNSSGMALEMVRSSNKRKYGVKQDVHWHNRPDQQQKHYGSPNVVYWPNTSGPNYQGLDPVTASSERQCPPVSSQTSGYHAGIRRIRERGASDCSSQGHLTVQVSPGAFAAAAHQAGYPVTQVPSLMASPSRGEHPGGPQGNAKPLAKVYFNSVGKPAVCKLQLSRYSHKKMSLGEASQDFPVADANRAKDTPGRPAYSARHHCSSESAAVSASSVDVSSEGASVGSPVVSSIRPAAVPPSHSTQPLMTVPVLSHSQPLPPPPPPPNAAGLENQVVTGVQLLPYINVPFVSNLSGPVDMSADFSKDAMGRDLPQADTSTLRYFFNLGIQYFRMSLSQALPQPPPSQPATASHWMPLSNVQCAPQVHPHPATQTPGSLNPQHHSSPVSGQSVRVVPLMDIEHAHQQQQQQQQTQPQTQQQQQQTQPQPPQQQTQPQPQQPQQQQTQAPPSQPQVTPGNITSIGGMIFAPCSLTAGPNSLFPTGSPSQPIGSFPGSVYVGPSYYSMTPGGPCAVHGLEGAPVLTEGPSGVTSGAIQDGMPPLAAPLQIGAGAVSGPPPSWAYSPTAAYCYI